MDASKPTRRRSVALRVALLYLTVGLVWIVASDRVAVWLLPDTDPMGWLQTAKGWLFVVGSALLIYLVTRRQVRRVESSADELSERNRQVEQVAAASAESERRLQTLMRNLRGMAYRCHNDPSWTMAFVSEGCVRVTGYPAEALVDDRDVVYGDLIVASDRERVWAEVQRAIEERRSFELEYRIVDAEGGERWVWERGVAVLAEDGTVEALEGFITDVTELVQAREQLDRSQRLEAVGRLAGGIAHDFNNMLSVILTFADLIAIKHDDDPALAADLEQVRGAALRAEQLTSQLLAFGRGQMLEARPLPLSHVVDDTAGMLRRLLGEDVELRLLAEPDPWLARVDPGRLQQVLVNMAVNASDAMPQGGTLTVHTSNVEVDDTLASQVGDLETGPHARLSISDTGHGMDDATRSRIFEPFFTTKPHGHGTGLGLASAYGFVHQSGGAIEVSSEPGKGTAFRIYLPRVAGEVTAEAPTALESISMASGDPDASILVVEDEPALRVALIRILEQQGYRVVGGRGAGAGVLVGAGVDDGLPGVAGQGEVGAEGVGEVGGVGGDVEDAPVGGVVGVGVEEGEGEELGVGRDAGPGELGGDALGDGAVVAAVFDGDRGALGELARGQGEGAACVVVPCVVVPCVVVSGVVVPCVVVARGRAATQGQQDREQQGQECEWASARQDRACSFHGSTSFSSILADPRPPDHLGPKIPNSEIHPEMVGHVFLEFSDRGSSDRDGSRSSPTGT